MAANLVVMGNKLGCRRQFFKDKEGKPGDGVCVFKFRSMRLYCLYYDSTAVFFGSGGYKPPEVHAYQEVPELDEKAKQMIVLASKINRMIKEKDLIVNDDGSLTLEKEEYEDY